VNNATALQRPLNTQTRPLDATCTSHQTTQETRRVLLSTSECLTSRLAAC